MINENDQIRQIDNPDEGFKYKINRNDRFNVKNSEAVNGMSRPDLVNVTNPHIC